VRPEQLQEPFRAQGEHVAISLPGAQVLFTTRHGGCSRGPYASLNLGRFTDDDPHAVQRNRSSLEQGLGVQFLYGRQVHGARVRRMSAPSKDRRAEDADGQATTLHGHAPMVLTADCLPIAIAGEGAVAMLHAGWRGLDAGVVAEGVSAVRELGAAGPLAAAIGPGAGPCCYEVSEDVHAVFAAYGARRGDNLDLKAIARAQLELAGVASVHDAGLCTICSELFYSHRRDHGLTGRQAGIAWLS
jgi:purine-nucleoside/S-methyl-5'-thioadenosine phosphorylase / adenosine deaminase